jgi:predicted nucleic acid-binding protein
MIVLDTMVLSELRKRRPAVKVVEWLGRQRESDLYLSVVSLGEIERGIEQQRKTNPEFALELARWLETLQQLYADRLLPVSASIARRWGVLSAQLGHDSADLLIAATALTHGLAVATRNVRHFKATGVQVVNPFDS